MLSADFVKAFAELAQKAKTPTISEPAGERGRNYLVVTPDGTIAEHATKPAYRDHQAYSLQAVLEFADMYFDEQAPHEHSCIWYSRTGVVCLINDEDRRDKVTFTLTESEQLSALTESHGMPQKQAALILWLRTVMADCLEQCPNLIDSLRTLQFRVEQDAGGVVKHGKSSLGKSVLAQLNQADSVPELVTFTVPIFEQGSVNRITAPIKVAIEISPAEETFRLIPLTGAIENALTAGEEQLRSMLAAHYKGPIYYGTP